MAQRACCGMLPPSAFLALKSKSTAILPYGLRYTLVERTWRSNESGNLSWSFTCSTQAVIATASLMPAVFAFFEAGAAVDPRSASET